MSSENSVSLHETETNDINLNDPHLLGMNNIKCELQQYPNIGYNQPQHLTHGMYNTFGYIQENGNNFNGFPTMNFNPDHRLQFHNYNLQQFGQDPSIMSYLTNNMNPQNMIAQNMNLETQLIPNDMNSSKASSELNSSYNNKSGKGEKDDRYKMRRSKNNQAAKKCRDKKKTEIDKMFEEKKRLENNNKSMEHLILKRDMDIAQKNSELNQKNIEINEKDNLIQQLSQKLKYYENMIHQRQTQMNQ